MTNQLSYYVIAPIDGLHLDFDYRMYSAEIYGCPPNYTPNPRACSEFRQPYEYLGSFMFNQYKQLSDNWEIDKLSLDCISDMPTRKFRDFTCIAFQVDLDKPNHKIINDETADRSLFDFIIEKGERFLDVWRLSLFKPGEDFSIGSFGAVGNGIQCFWIGQDNVPPKFIARKTSRYQLVQKPVDMLLSDFGALYADMTFKNLSYAAFHHSTGKDDIHSRLFEALRAFRQSRDLQNFEARYRHLASIAEDLSKRTPDERLQGDMLKNRISSIAANGWRIYKSYSSSLMPYTLPSHQYRSIWKRYEDLGWVDKEQVRNIVQDLWRNVRNPLSHTVTTFSSMKRDPVADLKNMDQLIVTMINGINAAYEVEEFYEGDIYDILLRDD